MHYYTPILYQSLSTNPTNIVYHPDGFATNWGYLNIISGMPYPSPISVTNGVVNMYGGSQEILQAWRPTAYTYSGILLSNPTNVYDGGMVDAVETSTYAGYTNSSYQENTITYTFPDANPGYRYSYCKVRWAAYGNGQVSTFDDDTGLEVNAYSDVIISVAPDGVNWHDMGKLSEQPVYHDTQGFIVSTFGGWQTDVTEAKVRITFYGQSVGNLPYRSRSSCNVAVSDIYWYP